MRKSLRAGGRVLRFEAVEPRCFLSATVGCATALEYDAHSEIVATAVAQETPAALWGGVPDAPSATLVPQIQKEYGLTGEGQTIAVIDSGIAYDHVALGGGFGDGYRVVGGYDFAENDANPYDDGPMGAHGTHVAGILGSTNYACPGLAPGADLVALRVFDDSGHGEFGWVEDALQWVHDHRNDFEHTITTVNLSLGAAWNGNNAPDWAMLEEEFAQLQADGIFISVAAGNSFQQYNQPGMSYPAASEYVVPVASVDANGLLSSFSQRSDRVIAAPGRSILSTVPDYLGDGNGKADDYAQFSGTSMASPFVAGASVLLRQAYESVGMKNVTGQTIYDLMVKTADDVYDAITGESYHRLNLERAIKAALASRPVAPPIDPPADPPADPQTPVPVDWGQVAQATFAGIQLDSAGQTYVLQAAHNGILTIEAGAAPASSTVLALYGADGRLVASSVNGRIDAVAIAGEHFTLKASSVGARLTVSLRVTNLVGQSGSTVSVFGTAGDDQFVFHAGARPEVSIGGTVYVFDAAQARVVQWDGGAGNDSATLVGTSAVESITARPLSAEMVGAGYQVRVSGAENIAIDALGGYDRAVFDDSTGDDRFTAEPGSATMSGPGFRNRVERCRSIYANASAGNDTAALKDSSGSDVLVASPTNATLSGLTFFLRVGGFDQVSVQATGGYDVGMMIDSAGDDLLSASGGKAVLRGAGYENRASGFDSLTVNSTAGGKDRAVFSLDATKERFVRNGVNADLDSPLGNVRARYFEEIASGVESLPMEAAAIESLLRPQRTVKKTVTVDTLFAQGAAWL